MPIEKQKRRGRYYLSRVLKGGRLDSPGVIAALKAAVDVEMYSHGWTITDFQTGHFSDGKEYIFAFLTKYDSSGIVKCYRP